MTDETLAELNRLMTELENSATTVGGRAVVKRSALEALAEAFGTWPELRTAL
jgi:hypothetical protein